LSKKIGVLRASESANIQRPYLKKKRSCIYMNYGKEFKNFTLKIRVLVAPYYDTILACTPWSLTNIIEERQNECGSNGRKFHV
jgi:hypothetical protein